MAVSAFQLANAQLCGKMNRHIYALKNVSRRQLKDSFVVIQISERYNFLYCEYSILFVTTLCHTDKVSFFDTIYTNIVSSIHLVWP